MTVLKGSLKTHWMMYVNYVNLNVNPADRVGMNNANGIVRLMMGLNSKFLQPGFEFKHEYAKPKTYYEPSIMHLKFVNGYERKYNIGISTMRMMQTDVMQINKYVEFERALEGQDDELEDDEWTNYCFINIYI